VAARPLGYRDTRDRIHIEAREMQLRRETLGSQIYDLLRDRILYGQLPGGARILQSALSEEMGISRIPIRDALQRLESDGLIVGDEIGRYTVAQFSAAEAEEIYAIRRKLEPFAIEIAAQRMSDAAIADLKALHAELTHAARERDLHRYTELNIRFHLAIYAASGMKRLVRIIRGLWRGVPQLTPIVLEGRMSRSQREHDEIMKRLIARDGDGAARALECHIDNAGAELRRSMGEAGPLRSKGQ
jgi:DNA-binding GntR family transcriptional regulator